MVRLYRILAQVLTVYALLHPFAYLGSEWMAYRDIQADAVESMPAGWTVSHKGTEFTAEIGDGTPLLDQHMVYESVFSLRNILHTLLFSIGILGVGALCQIAAAATDGSARAKPTVARSGG